MSDFAIDIHSLSKSFNGRKVIDDFAIQVPKAQIYGFLGPNGSGKTTTLRLICGLLKADAGEGTCLGYDIIRDSLSIKRNVGYMPQRFSLYEDLTVKENLDLVARIYGIDPTSPKVKETVKWLGLDKFSNHLAETLSGGWKQRLSLGAAIIHGPKLLLLDEPTAGIDPKARREFWNYIHHLSERGVTILVSTHYMDEAERCHQIAYLFYGKILLVGEPHKVVEDSQLTTYRTIKIPSDQVIQFLEKEPDIEQVSHFGSHIHITGTDAELLKKITAKYHKNHDIDFEKITPSLEDVFVHFTTVSES